MWFLIPCDEMTPQRRKCPRRYFKDNFKGCSTEITELISWWDYSNLSCEYTTTEHPENDCTGSGNSNGMHTGTKSTGGQGWRISIYEDEAANSVVLNKKCVLCFRLSSHPTAQCSLVWPHLSAPLFSARASMFMETWTWSSRASHTAFRF